MLAAFLILGSVASHAAVPAPSGLTVVGGEVTRYRGARGEIYEARYFGLSDGSLSFVKVKMPDGKEYTLPQALSASGARYTDDRALVWWEHQGRVRIDARNADGEWKTVQHGLQPVGR